ncbi:hypothetical protein CHELA41_21988 [Hyphomicrobiales bacterium]|nr:hypothetical protein CHELA41_21988 [Hyphomicrobiales bacterium]
MDQDNYLRAGRGRLTRCAIRLTLWDAPSLLGLRHPVALALVIRIAQAVF